ncbi:OTU domain-containing protein [Quillaja saponaria]|uniref:ubiquitinyl hydrolase 1 n=1 Tax=Quillaja saponaria TaxID=32244 RepID=A0AAD7Q542_QUISA|nr:OTU domain-containing protein [Quillaja saponaria]
MAAHNMDPDVLRWGLHLLDVCTLSNSGSPGIITGYDSDLSQCAYMSEGYCEPTCVLNDEAVARAFQEELSRLDCVEASGLSHVGDEHTRASILAQDWLGPSKRNYDFEIDNCQKEVNRPNSMIEVENHFPRVKGNDVAGEIEISGSCSGPGEKLLSSKDLLHSMEISDESDLDGEVGKRLNHMVPVPHVPKTNEKIPSDDEEISDHQRLLDRLQLYDLVECKIQGDGNCQFRALSDQLYRSPEHHKFVREQVIEQLKSHAEMYAGYVPMAYNDYLKKISKSGEWGDHVTLQAAADWYGVKIFVITSFKDTCYIEILPQIQKSTRVICLSFWAEVHYNSIYPEAELPSSSLKKKKKWWNFSS